MAKSALEKAKAKGVKFLLPVDTFMTENFDFRAAKTISPGQVPASRARTFPMAGKASISGRNR